MKILSATDSIFHTATMSDEDIARMEEENAAARAWLDDQTAQHGGRYEHPEAQLHMERERQEEQERMRALPEPHRYLDRGGVDVDDDDFNDEMDAPRNTSLADHQHVRGAGYRYNNSDVHPKYEREINREILDSDGRPGYANEGHVIERNTHVTEPGQSGDHPLAYPWMHTYYPAFMDDDHGLVAGYNDPRDATLAAAQLSLYGARHPNSQQVLRNYQYVGNDQPYDPSIELPHEAAMRASRS